MLIRAGLFSRFTFALTINYSLHLPNDCFVKLYCFFIKQAQEVNQFEIIFTYIPSSAFFLAFSFIVLISFDNAEEAISLSS